MHQDEEKPPAPPLRLTSASNNAHKGISLPVDMRPLPKEPPEGGHKKAKGKKVGFIFEQQLRNLLFICGNPNRQL